VTGIRPQDVFIAALGALLGTVIRRPDREAVAARYTVPVSTGPDDQDGARAWLDREAERIGREWAEYGGQRNGAEL
jgi:hypothetical protein